MLENHLVRETNYKLQKSMKSLVDCMKTRIAFLCRELLIPFHGDYLETCDESNIDTLSILIGDLQRARDDRYILELTRIRIQSFALG